MSINPVLTTVSTPPPVITEESFRDFFIKRDFKLFLEVALAVFLVMVVVVVVVVVGGLVSGFFRGFLEVVCAGLEVKNLCFNSFFTE